MRRFLSSLAVFAIVAVAISLRAVILDLKQLSIDFTNKEDAKAKAEWSHPDKLTFTAAGLGRQRGSWDNDWIQTQPIPVGLSWRPPTGVSIEVKILPPPKAQHRFENGKEIWSSEHDDLYARYSPDFQHWSSWQVLQRDEKKTDVGIFTGGLAVPAREYQKYWSYLQEYEKLDVPWTSDEEAAVAWILKREPAFFAHSLPFIGYVQFLFEPANNQTWRIRRFEATISYGVSGLSSEPKDQSISRMRDEIPWRFKAP
jgi:hypothetical protein